MLGYLGVSIIHRTLAWIYVAVNMCKCYFCMLVDTYYINPFTDRMSFENDPLKIRNVKPLISVSQFGLAVRR